VPVTPALNVAEHPEVYVVRRPRARSRRTAQLLPQVAQVALQQGTAAAENIVRSLRSLPPRPFHYKNLACSR
jgi:NADH dehydrogenase FAD-containing subunit